MANGQLPLVSFISLALQGCATAPLPMPVGPGSVLAYSPCLDYDNRNNCSVRVIVTVNGGQCKLSIAKEQVYIGFARGSQNIKIRWELDREPGFTFTLDGIAIDNNHAPREFINAKILQGGRAYEWHNKNSFAYSKNYKYTIHVANEQVDPVLECEPLDPWINNQ